MSKIKELEQKNFKYKKNFFFLWKLVRLRDILNVTHSSLISWLNEIGWMFREDTIEERIYNTYITAEALERKIAWIHRDIRETDKKETIISKEQIDYIIHIAEKVDECISDGLRYVYFSRGREQLYILTSAKYLKQLKKTK